MSHPHPAHDPNCLFCKIAAKQIPSGIVYEDEEVFAFHDIHPWAPVHFLLIPKMHIPSMAQVGAEHAALLGRMMALVPQLALVHQFFLSSRVNLFLYCDDKVFPFVQVKDVYPTTFLGFKK